MLRLSCDDMGCGFWLRIVRPHATYCDALRNALQCPSQHEAFTVLSECLGQEFHFDVGTDTLV